jgi:hypothetical protein
MLQWRPPMRTTSQNRNIGRGKEADITVAAERDYSNFLPAIGLKEWDGK